MGREQLLGAAVAVVGVAVVAVGGYTLANPPPASSDAAQPAVQAPASISAGPTQSVPGSTAPSVDPGPSSTVATTSAAPSTGPTTSAPTSATPDRKAPLVVLNNTTVAGVASRAADRFRDGGWTVTFVGNLRNDILSSCAYYDPIEPGAQDAAAALRAQFPGLKRTAPKFSGLPAGPVVVVLTPDWS